MSNNKRISLLEETIEVKKIQDKGIKTILDNFQMNKELNEINQMYDKS